MLMTPDEYDKFVLSKINPAVLNSAASTLLMSALGLTGEAGEYADRVKKAIYHGLKLSYVQGQRETLDELGDVLFYLTAAAKVNGFTLQEVLDANVIKLRLRYPEGFDAKDPLRRARKESR